MELAEDMISSDFVARVDALRAELAQRTAEHGMEFRIVLDEAQALDLASGYVPNSVKAMLTAALDWAAEDQRRADRPLRRRRGTA